LIVSKIVFVVIGGVLAGAVFVIFDVLTSWSLPLAARYLPGVAEFLPERNLLTAFSALAVYHANAKLYLRLHRDDGSWSGSINAWTWFTLAAYRIAFPIAYWLDHSLWAAVVLYLAAFAVAGVWSLFAGVVLRLLTPDWLLNRLDPHSGWLMGFTLAMASWPAAIVTLTFLKEPLGPLGRWLGIG
jgi:hypothetical protein